MATGSTQHKQWSGKRSASSTQRSILQQMLVFVIPAIQRQLIILSRFWPSISAHTPEPEGRMVNESHLILA
ncbi:MAG TPA: hypothetical protein DEF45_08095 [Rhodopirellula sp.]|nr:MAG: hypothetical protein CBD74_12590 [Saprospirales bacterium TMED214]HBV62966.1 hypothetical protein [Rhodopirellula sp.]